MKNRWLPPGVLVVVHALAGCADVIGVKDYEVSSPSTGGSAQSLCSPGTGTACYEGPFETERVGVCAGGIQFCNALGTGYGPCLGQVLPAVEQCGLPARDENCDGALDCTGKQRWSGSFGEAVPASNRGIAADRDGNVLITGNFAGTIDFGAGALQSMGDYDIFVAKFDPSGKPLWAHRFGDGNEAQYGQDVAVDAVGNIFITGFFGGTVDFGGGARTSVGGLDIFVAKFDPSGTHVWSKSFGDAGDQDSVAIAVDGNGNVLFSGGFTGTVDFEGGLITSIASKDIYVVKLDTSGKHVWSKSFGDLMPVPWNPSDQWVNGIAVDPAGNTVLTGAFEGIVDFGSGFELHSAGGPDIFAVKLNVSGNPIWCKGFGGYDWDMGQSVTVDDAGNVLLTGIFMGEADFGDGPVKSIGGSDVFATKLDSLGNPLWSDHFGSGYSEAGCDIAADDAGNVIIAGYFNTGTIDFGGGSLTSAGGCDPFVVKLDPFGNHLWSKRFGDASPGQYGSGVAVDPLGNVFLRGSFEGSIDLGGGPLTAPPGGSSLFIAKLRP